MADLRDLDGVYTLSTAVTEDPRLRSIYEVLISRMQDEAKHLKMNTVQQLLIERIASNYIALRAKEDRRVGEVGGFAHSTAQKEFNTFWLTMTQEFNKQLRDAAKADRSSLLKEVMELIRQVVSEEDTDTRIRLLMKFADAFEHTDL